MNSGDCLINKVRKFYEYIEHPTSMALLLTIICYKTVMIMEAEYDVVLRALFSASCYICTIILSRQKEFFKIITRSKVVRATFVISWLYLTFAVWGAWYLDSDSIWNIKLGLMYLGVASWTYPIMAVGTMGVSKAASRIKEQDAEYPVGFSVKIKLLWGAILVALCCIMLVAFNPAITSTDSADCYVEAYRIILGKPIGDDHPFFYIFLLSLVMRINTSISFIILVQVVFYSIICVKSVDFLRRMGANKEACALIFLFWGIGYNTILQMVTLWKDIPYAISLLWLTVLLAEHIVLPRQGRKEFLWYFELVIACAVVGNARHGGLIPVVVSMVVLFICSKEKKRIAIGIVAVVTVLLLIRFPLRSALKVSNLDSNFKFSALADDIEYVYYNGGDISEEGVILVNAIANGSPETYEFNAWYGTGTYPNMGDVSTIKFIEIYTSTFIRNPLLMLKGVLVRNNYLWTVVIPQKGQSSCVARMTEKIPREGSEISYPTRKENILTALLGKLIQNISFVPIINMLYWRVGLYTFIIVAMLLWVVGKKRKIKYIVPFIPILMNCFVLIVACAWPNYRYYWPNALLCGFLLVYSIVISGEKTEVAYAM